MKWKRTKKPVKIKALAVVGSLSLSVGVTHLALVGYSDVVAIVVVVAALVLVLPSIAAGDSLLEIIVSFFRMFAEGIFAILDAIASLFSW